MAANELGVLFARYGQLKKARSVLQYATKISTEPEPWYNLAKVYQREGQPREAQRAMNQYHRLKAAAEQANNKRPEQQVTWVSPDHVRNTSDPAGLGLHERSEQKSDESESAKGPDSQLPAAQPGGERVRSGPLQTLGRLIRGKGTPSKAAD